MSYFCKIVPKRVKDAFREQKWYHDRYSTSGDSIERFKFEGEDIRSDVENRYQYRGDLLDIYVKGSDQVVHKWHHYLPIYDRYFSKWRGKKVRFLEIGVYKGGSLSMWRQYFGDQAVIYGVDIDENCSQYDGLAGAVRIGSQNDPQFLKRVIKEMGGVDIVLDDGSHMMKHIRTSIEVIMPLMANDGIYMIEDLHTSYWRNYGGGLTKKANFFNFVREVIDDIHHWYHDCKPRLPNVSSHCSSIHIHDSICVFEKAQPQCPTHSMVQANDGRR